MDQSSSLASGSSSGSTVLSEWSTNASTPRPLSLDEYERYGRQMITPGFGLPGQLKLKAAKVAVIGAGGLGCPVLQYLAAAGVGTLTIIDHDTVSVSNLHRQVLHSTDRVGMNKALSACIAIKALNPHVQTIPHQTPLTPSNALSLLSAQTLLIDCTDRPLTRYLLSDTAVALSIPLISGAAISSAGQWAVYAGEIRPSPSLSARPTTTSATNSSSTTDKGKRRACYRCLWPKVVQLGPGGGRCDEVGVWGVGVGMIGVGMATEAIKVLIGQEDPEPLLHLMHIGSNPLIRTIRMRPPSPKCLACGPNANIKIDTYDYEEFCAGPAELSEAEGLELGGPDERIDVKTFAEVLISEEHTRDHGVLIIDTRPEIEHGICSIPNTTNIPFDTIMASPEIVNSDRDIILLCRRGNDSQVAAAAIRNRSGGATKVRVRDVRGGLVAWAKEIDPEFPIY